MEGRLVEVDGHKMNVYKEGAGEHTLLIMAGSGIVSPVYEYRSLYRRLSDTYRIVVVEKFGYGYSDIVDTERAFDIIIREYREALQKAGISGPFILCPHSMSGVEALKWAQEYPDEVEAIIGLDMAVPESYDTIDVRMARAKKVFKLAPLVGKLGLVRPSKTLTKEERREYKELIRTRFCNITVWNETLHIAAVRDEIRSRPKPSIPMLMFVSNGAGTGDSKEVWRGFAYAFAKGMDNVQIKEVNSHHKLYDVEYVLMAEEMKMFIGNALRKGL